MKLNAYATLAVLAFGAIAPAHAEQCPVSDVNPGFGITLEATCTDPQNGTNGTDGVDGTNGTNGTNADIDKALALGAAASTPVWLQQNENFAVSGGVGFTEGEAAFGANGVARIQGTPLSAFAGGAVSNDGADWVARGGLRAGW